MSGGGRGRSVSGTRRSGTPRESGLMICGNLAESEAASRLRIAAPGTCWSPVLYRAVSWEKSSTGIFDLALALAPRLGPRLALAVCAC